MAAAPSTVPSAKPARRHRVRVARWLPLGAVGGPVLFTTAWLVLGFVSPGYRLWDMPVEGYSAISQPVSGLGLGATAAYMNTAFVASGVLIIVGAFGIFGGIEQMPRAARWSCAGLLAVHGFGAVVDGIFTLESIVLHSLGFMFALSPIVTFLVISRHLRRIPGWRRLGTWLLVASPVTLILAVVHLATFDPGIAGSGLGVGGLSQRVLLVELQAWVAAMGWLALRRRPAAFSRVMTAEQG